MLYQHSVKRSRIKPILFVLVLVMFSFLSALPTFAEVQQSIVTIANQANFSYYIPEVQIAPSGAIYVVYEAKDKSSGRSDIYLSKYENETVSFVKNISESRTHSRDADIFITTDGTLHIAWAEQSGSYITTKYRYHTDENGWSQIFTLGQRSGISFIEDLRIHVDSMNNLFLVYTHFPENRCQLYSKYGNNTYGGSLPASGRSKHADITADNNNVFLSWQQIINGSYTVVISRRQNKAGSSWDSWKTVAGSPTQRPRLDTDRNGVLHLSFAYKASSSAREMYYKVQEGSSFAKAVLILPAATYHFFDMAVVDKNNVIVTVQKGSGTGGQNITYNWKKNGVWQGARFFGPSTSRAPVYQSVDLSQDSLLATVAFTEREKAVHLILAQEQGGTGKKPVAGFTYSPKTGSIPLEVHFDASKSYDEDGDIASYNWEFGDGEFGEGKTITHTYTKEGTYTIQLTVIDDFHNTATATGKVTAVKILPPQSVTFTHVHLRGFLFRQDFAQVDWEMNPGNPANGINIVSYNLYRKAPGESYSLYQQIQAEGKSEFSFIDMLTSDSPHYIYTVTSVAEDGRESEFPHPTDLTNVTWTIEKTGNKLTTR